MIKEIYIPKIESELFNNVTKFNSEYKNIKKLFLNSLGIPENKRIPSGYLLLQREESEGKFIRITSGTLDDMKEYIKNGNGKNFKLVIKENTWKIKIN